MFFLFFRKRAESEARKGSLPSGKEMPSHHPTDPVELRRLNFQTPGKSCFTQTQTNTNPQPHCPKKLQQKVLTPAIFP